MSGLVISLTATDGTPVNARLVRMDEGELLADVLGRREGEYLGDVIQFYDAARTSLDPLGFPVGICSLDLGLERLTLKNGKFRLSYPRRCRGRQAHLTIRPLWLSRAEAQRLAAWIAAYEQSVDYEAQAAAFVARPERRGRLSPLATRLA